MVDREGKRVSLLIMKTLMSIIIMTWTDVEYFLHSYGIIMV